MAANTTDSITYFPATSVQDSEPSTSFWLHARSLAFRIGPPIILSLGTAGNILIIIVLRRMGTESSTMPLFFTALAASDLALLYVGIFPVWLENQFGFALTSTHSAVCKVNYWTFFSLGWLSSWLLVAMTIQRAMSVVWPHRVKQACTHQQAHATIAILVTVLFGININLLFGVDISQELGRCFFTDSYLRQFLDVYIWIDLMLSSILPFGLLLCSNSVLIWKVLQSVRAARANLTGIQAEQVNARQKKFSSMTVMLIVASGAFIILTGPINAVSLVTYFTEDTAAENDRTKSMPFLIALANLLWYTNSAVNFFLYMLTGSRFRQEFKKVFCTAGKPQAGCQRNLTDTFCQ